MWQWHDGKAAMEFMWRTGQLAVPRREGFQKVYDLAERVIPQVHYNSEVPHDEFISWACRSALDRLGFGTAKDIAKYWDLISIKEVNEWLSTHGRQEIEIYVPPEKRKYGYYVHPLLEKDKLIGRIDFQAQRNENRLFVKQIWLEPKVRWSQTKQDKLQAELLRQARLCSVKDIIFSEDCDYRPN